jgi:hypothetical protein
MLESAPIKGQMPATRFPFQTDLPDSTTLSHLTISYRSRSGNLNRHNFLEWELTMYRWARGLRVLLHVEVFGIGKAIDV